MKFLVLIAPPSIYHNILMAKSEIKKPAPSPRPYTSPTALYGGKKKNAEISWKTVLNKMVQKNAFTEEEADND